MMKHNPIIAHRGESFEAPENTLAAVNLAWSENNVAVEIDVHMTLDSEIVVIHDDDTLRVSGKKLSVKESTLGELRLLDAGSYKHPRFRNERIPTLKEVLETVPSHGRLIIEIKSDAGIIEKLNALLAKSGLKNHQIEIIAFDLDTLVKAKKLMPQYRMLWLLDLDYSKPWWLCWTSKKSIINTVCSNNLDGVDVWCGKLLNRRFIEEFKRNGLLVYTWTVNDPERARTLLDDGIDGITTDRASWLWQKINSKI